MLKDIEKLLKKPVPRREHPFPMEVFEAPKKDAKGRPINPEDAEARQAAREKNAARKQQAAEKAAQSQAEPATEKPGKKKKKKAKTSAEVPAPEKPEKVRRTFPHGKQNRGDLQAFLDSQPQEAAPVVFAHRNPLEGDVIMDATARLLASKPVYQYYKPPKASHPDGQGKKKKGKKEAAGKEAAPAKAPIPAEKAGKAHHRQGPKKGVPAPLNKTHSKRSNRGRIPPRVEPPKSRQKDSTEQKSLMKPFYIDHD